MPADPTRYLALEGPDGSAKSTHSDALAAALRERGYDATSWHHEPHPDGAAGLARVAHYIAARRALLLSPPAAVTVLDRGPMSGVVYARSMWLAFVPYAETGMCEAAFDASHWWSGLPLVVLDAPDAELDARLAARGEDPSLSHPERREWRRCAEAWGWRVVDTGRPREDVTAELVAWAIARLA